MSKLKVLNKILRRKGFNKEANIVHRIDKLEKYSISKEEVRRLNDWFQKDKSLLSFDNLFGGKLRIIVPFNTKEQRELIEIVLFLKRNGWTPSGGNNSFDIKKVKQKFKRLETAEEYEETKEVADLKVSKSEKRIIPAGPRKGEETVSEVTTTISKVLANPKYKAPDWMSTWWQKAQSEYASDYNWKQLESVFKDGELSSKHSIIISRNPIDVLRMSDHENIRSCHSEGSSYFNCAISESKGNGLVAYLVETRELNKVLVKKDPWGWDPETGKGPEKMDIGDLDNEELFYDRERGIPGIKAKSRLRLRKYVNHEEGYEFAVPENRTYGPHPPGFKSLVRGWAWDNQKHLFDYEEGEHINLPHISDLEMHGGSYRDTSDGEILNAFFLEGDIDGRFAGNAETISDNEESVFDMWNDEINEINERAGIELEHAWFYAHVEMTDEGDPYVYSSASLDCEIPLYGWEDLHFENNYAKTNSGFNPIPISYNAEGYRYFKELLEHEASNYVELINVSPANNALTFRLDFECDDCVNPDDVADFLQYIKSDIDEEFYEYIEKTRRKLIDEEYIGKIEFDYVAERLESAEFENLNVFGTDEDDTDGEIIVSTKPGLIPLNFKFPSSQYDKSLPEILNSNFNAKKTSSSAYTLKDEPLLVINHLNKISKDAYEAAKKQLYFPFYTDDTELQDFSNIIKSFQIRLMTGHDSITELSLSVKLQVRDAEEQTLSLESFIMRLDQNLYDIVSIIRDSLFAKYKASAEKAKASMEAFYNGDLSRPIIQNLKSYSQPDVKRLALWIERNWGSFNNAEKEVAHYSYLIPTQNNGDYVHKDEEDAPRFWNSVMQQRPDTDISYRWSGLSMKDVMPYTDMNAPIGIGLPPEETESSEKEPPVY